MWKFEIAFVLFSQCFLPAKPAGMCSRGQYLYTPRYGPDICLWCNAGTVMPHHHHTERMCFDCSKITDPLKEGVTHNCNETHDTVISCLEGYFRTKPKKPEEKSECKKCTECPHRTRPCQSHSDTICCPDENYDVAPNEHGIPVCVKVCGRGQYLDLTTDTCSPCPANKFMDSVRHPFIQCQGCVSPQNELEAVVKPCKPGSQAIIGCVDGYYRKIDKNHPIEKCVKCKNCTENLHFDLYEGRKCDYFHDTVCCIHPTMTVIDMADGPRCQGPPSVITCGQGTYLSTSNTSQEITCQPCPPGTYMERLTHTQTSCKNCSSYKGNHVPTACPLPLTMTGELDNAKFEFDAKNWIILATVIGIVVIVVIVLVFAIKQWQLLKENRHGLVGEMCLEKGVLPLLKSDQEEHNKI